MEHPEDALPADFVDALLDRREASAYLASLGVRRSPATLAKIVSTRDDGPPCTRHGRRALYSKRQLHEWGVRKLSELRRPPRVKPSAGFPSSNA